MIVSGQVTIGLKYDESRSVLAYSFRNTGAEAVVLRDPYVQADLEVTLDNEVRGGPATVWNPMFGYLFTLSPGDSKRFEAPLSAYIFPRAGTYRARINYHARDPMIVWPSDGRLPDDIAAKSNTVEFTISEDQVRSVKLTEFFDMADTHPNDLERGEESSAKKWWQFWKK